MLYRAKEDLLNDIEGVIDIQKNGVVKIIDKDSLRNKKIDTIVYNAVYNKEGAMKGGARWLICNVANKLGAVPSSIQSLYVAMGRKEYKGFTVPAIDIRIGISNK
jgi:hypothetical protein